MLHFLMKVIQVVTHNTINLSLQLLFRRKNGKVSNLVPKRIKKNIIHGII